MHELDVVWAHSVTWHFEEKAHNEIKMPESEKASSCRASVRRFPPLFLSHLQLASRHMTLLTTFPVRDTHWTLHEFSRKVIKLTAVCLANAFPSSAPSGDPFAAMIRMAGQFSSRSVTSHWS
jgi:hypothetical protein